MIMVRRLGKRVFRRVGEKLVVGLTEEGLVLRGHFKRASVVVPWSTIGAEFLPANDWETAFAVPSPGRWIPKSGEMVWMKRDGWKSGHRVTVIKVLPCLGDPIVCVVHRGVPYETVLAKLRPCPNQSSASEACDDE